MVSYDIGWGVEIAVFGIDFQNMLPNIVNLKSDDVMMRDIGIERRICFADSLNPRCPGRSPQHYRSAKALGRVSN